MTQQVTGNELNVSSGEGSKVVEVDNLANGTVVGTVPAKMKRRAINFKYADDIEAPCAD